MRKPGASLIGTLYESTDYQIFNMNVSPRFFNSLQTDWVYRKFDKSLLSSAPTYVRMMLKARPGWSELILWVGSAHCTESCCETGWKMAQFPSIADLGHQTLNCWWWRGWRHQNGHTTFTSCPLVSMTGRCGSPLSTIKKINQLII